VYVVATARHDLVQVWRVVEPAFEPHRPPSTVLGVAMLGYESQLVEIEAVALAPAEGEPAPSP
jgi:enamine deaminase RidA (YjgF/YER057c/UK114 family)